MGASCLCLYYDCVALSFGAFAQVIFLYTACLSLPLVLLPSLVAVRGVKLCEKNHVLWEELSIVIDNSIVCVPCAFFIIGNLWSVGGCLVGLCGTCSGLGGDLFMKDDFELWGFGPLLASDPWGEGLFRSTLGVWPLFVSDS